MFEVLVILDVVDGSYSIEPHIFPAIPARRKWLARDACDLVDCSVAVMDYAVNSRCGRFLSGFISLSSHTPRVQQLSEKSAGSYFVCYEMPEKIGHRCPMRWAKSAASDEWGIIATLLRLSRLPCQAVA